MINPLGSVQRQIFGESKARYLRPPPEKHKFTENFWKLE